MKDSLLEEVLNSQQDLLKYIKAFVKLPESRSKDDPVAWLEAKKAILERQKQELERLSTERAQALAEYEDAIREQKDMIAELELEIRNETDASLHQTRKREPRKSK